MRRKILKRLGVSFAILVALSVGAEAEAPQAQKAARLSTHFPSLASLERLDSAANLLMTVADGDKPGACGIAPSEAKRLLMAIHPLMDEKRNAAIAALPSNSSRSKSIAQPEWERNCLRKCHCGLYESILEGVGEDRLAASDRTALNRISSKARGMKSEQLVACAKSSQWFCKSRLLVELRRDAKGFPAP